MAGLMVFSGSSGASSRLDAVRMTARLAAFADLVGPQIKREITDRAPRGKGPQPGRLANSTHYSRRSGPGMVRMEFTSDVPYAPFVIKATKPHDIVPKNARMLHWQTPGGVGAFARRVHHPGTKANEYPQAALRRLMPMLALQFHATMGRT